VNTRTGAFADCIQVFYVGFAVQIYLYSAAAIMKRRNYGYHFLGYVYAEFKALRVNQREIPD
jgi:hypothetical protein